MSTSFSFGSTAASAPTVAAPSSGGFSFGGATAAPAPVSTAPAAGGFMFPPSAAPSVSPLVPPEAESINAYDISHSLTLSLRKLSPTCTRVEDSFTILSVPNEEQPLDTQLLWNGSYGEPEKSNGGTAYGLLYFSESLRHDLLDPRTAGFCLRTTQAPLATNLLPIDVPLPPGAEPAVVIVWLGDPPSMDGLLLGTPTSSRPNVQLTFSLFEGEELDGGSSRGDQLFHKEVKTDREAAVAVGGLPRSGSGCVLRIACSSGTAMVNGLSIQVVLRRGVNAPLYRMIGAIRAAPAPHEPVSSSGLALLVAHLNHTLPSEVLHHILLFFLPRASALDEEAAVSTKTGASWKARGTPHKKEDAALVSKGPFGGRGRRIVNRPNNGFVGFAKRPHEEEQDRFAPTKPWHAAGEAKGFAGQPLPGEAPKHIREPNDHSVPFIVRQLERFMISFHCVRKLSLSRYPNAYDNLGVNMSPTPTAISRSGHKDTPLSSATSFFGSASAGVTSQLLWDEPSGRIAYGQRCTPTFFFGSSDGVKSSKALEDFFHHPCSGRRCIGFEVLARNDFTQSVPIPNDSDGAIGNEEGQWLLVMHTGSGDPVKRRAPGSGGGGFGFGAAPGTSGSEVELQQVALPTITAGIAGCLVPCWFWLPRKLKKLDVQATVAATEFSLRVITQRGWQAIQPALCCPTVPTNVADCVVVPCVVANIAPAPMHILQGRNPRYFAVGSFVKVRPYLGVGSASEKEVALPAAGGVIHVDSLTKSKDGLLGVVMELDNFEATLPNHSTSLPLLTVLGMKAVGVILSAEVEFNPTADGYPTNIGFLLSDEMNPLGGKMVAAFVDKHSTQPGFGMGSLPTPHLEKRDDSMTGIQTRSGLALFDEAALGLSGIPVPPPAPSPFTSARPSTTITLRARAAARKNPHIRIVNVKALILTKEGYAEATRGVLKAI